MILSGQMIIIMNIDTKTDSQQILGVMRLVELPLKRLYNSIILHMHTSLQTVRKHNVSTS